jgi:hypothetical protein
MTRIRQFTAAALAALMLSGIPALAAQAGYNSRDRGAMHYRSAQHQDQQRVDRYGSDRERRRYDEREYARGHSDNRAYAYDRTYAPAYGRSPVYAVPAYDYPYAYQHTHNGRTAAIIGGSAAAGAIIGAAAGHGQGAILGAVIGGVAGAAVSAAANHHDRY